MVVVTESQSRLDRNAWLRGALDMLRERGIDEVKIEPLAVRLGVTKGSFYWHFKDRGELLAILPQFWADNQTGPVLALGETVAGGPKEKLFAVAEFLNREDPDRYDNSMRAWAQFDKTVAAAVDDIDRRRLAFAAGIFESAGLATDEAAVRARLFYFFDVGGQITGEAEVSLAERQRRSIRRVELLTSDFA